MPTEEIHTRRTWLVTGASSGIGLALARAAADRGDNVVALARDTDSLKRLVDDHGARVLALTADVRRRGAGDLLPRPEPRPLAEYA